MLEEEIATKAHEGQTRYDGSPYIEHPRTVAAMVAKFGNDYMRVAYLHDVLEDTPVTAAQLLEAGVSAHVVKAVECITKHEGESYDKYLERVNSNRFSHVVKIFDMLHNLSSTPTKTQVKRYSEGLKYLLSETFII